MTFLWSFKIKNQNDLLLILYVICPKCVNFLCIAQSFIIYKLHCSNMRVWDSHLINIRLLLVIVQGTGFILSFPLGEFYIFIFEGSITDFEILKTLVVIWFWYPFHYFNNCQAPHIYHLKVFKCRYMYWYMYCFSAWSSFSRCWWFPFKRKQREDVSGHPFDGPSKNPYRNDTLFSLDSVKIHAWPQPAQVNQVFQNKYHM